jgi:hypothetical protein
VISFRAVARFSAVFLFLFDLGGPGVALAADGSVGGYFRVMTRPDFQGGDGKLGYWNLYGRLMNEGPYAALHSQLELLEQRPGAGDVWARVHAQVEGSTVTGADSGGGALSQMRLSQLYTEVGNVLGPEIIIRVGTLESWMGDLGLYDWRPTSLLGDTVGMSGTVRGESYDLLIGIGDAGFNHNPDRYNTLFSGGGSLRFRPIDQVEVGIGAQFRYEPAVVGNVNAPYHTPEVDYSDWLRGEVISVWAAENPGQLQNFPDPVSNSADSSKLVGYLGFGGVGPLVWNSLFVSYERLHPDSITTEVFEDVEYELFVSELTDERSVLTVAEELHLTIMPNVAELVMSAIYGLHVDGDNSVAPSDHARSYISTVNRLQLFLTPGFHLLVEGSLAKESSTNGNQYRDHSDSIFESSGGVSDSRGLEYGDASVRHTAQGKLGLVLNPSGAGIFTRPSLRLLYGTQWSSQSNAFGNSFVDSLDQYNSFGNVERHWHHMVSAETEVWF